MTDEAIPADGPGEVRGLRCNCGSLFRIREAIPYGEGPHTTITEALNAMPLEDVTALTAWYEEHKPHIDEAAAMREAEKARLQRLAAGGAHTDPTIDDVANALGAQ